MRDRNTGILNGSGETRWEIGIQESWMALVFLLGVVAQLGVILDSQFPLGRPSYRTCSSGTHSRFSSASAMILLVPCGPYHLNVVWRQAGLVLYLIFQIWCFMTWDLCTSLLYFWHQKCFLWFYAILSLPKATNSSEWMDRIKDTRKWEEKKIYIYTHTYPHHLFILVLHFYGKINKG